MQLVVHLVFILLLLCIAAWLLIKRKLDRQNPSAHPRYRQFQVLTGLIATLIMLLALLIVFSSDPGDPENYLWWP